MSSPLQQTYEQRRKALRKFDNFYNSFIDNNENDIITDKQEIRNLIERIRSLNRILADDDNLYDENLVEKFNSNARDIAQILKNNDDYSNHTSSSSIKNDIDSYKSNETHLQDVNLIENEENNQSNRRALVTFHGIDNIELNDENWFDYCPLMMEYIVTNPDLPDERTRIKILKFSIRKNSKAVKIIENETRMKMAVELLRKEFSKHTYYQRETLVQTMIESFKFDYDRQKDAQNFKTLFLIALQIKFNVRQEMRDAYITRLFQKIPFRYRLHPINHFVQIIRTKLSQFDIKTSIPLMSTEINYTINNKNHSTINDKQHVELKKLIERLIDERGFCPICYGMKKHLRSHSFIECKNLSQFLDRYRDQHKESMSNDRSIIQIGEQQEHKSKNDGQNAKRINMKTIPINLISIKRNNYREVIASVNNSIIDDHEALIEMSYLKSLELDIIVDNKSDWRSKTKIIDEVEIEMAIGFLIRKIKFGVFRSQDCYEPKVQISSNIFEKFSIHIEPFKFEQRLSKLVDCSLKKPYNDLLSFNNYSFKRHNDHVKHQNRFSVLESKSSLSFATNEDENETMKKFINNFLDKSCETQPNQSLKISMVDDKSNENHYMNSDRIYYEWLFAYKEQGLFRLEFENIYIFLLAGNNSNCSMQFDSILIKFDQMKFMIITPLTSNEQIADMIKLCQKLIEFSESEQ